MTIPRALTTAEQSTLSQIATEVSALAGQKANIPETLKEVAMLFLAFPSANVGEAAATARAEAYKIALEDLPTWAVTAAARRWVKGDVASLGDKVDMRFPPSPPQLRKLAAEELSEVRAVGVRCRRLMSAKVRKEIDAAQRAATAARIREIMNHQNSEALNG